MSVFVLDDLERIGQVLEDYAFFFCLFDLDHVSRHFVLGSSVDVVNLFSAKSDCCSASVHCGVSAADDGNLLAQFDFFVSDDLSQEVDTADNAFSIFARASNACGNPCADTEQYSIEVASDSFERDVFADLGVADDFNAHHFDGCDFFVQYSLWKSVFRNAVTQHTAGLRHGLEYSNFVAHLSEEVCSRKSHWAAADDGNSLACFLVDFRDKWFCISQILVCSESLEPLN